MSDETRDSGGKIKVGDLTDAQAIAIGEGAQATLNQYTEIIIHPNNLEDQPAVPGEPPYKGLTYFTEADQDIFFGREKLSDRLADRLHISRFLALIGASGSGKSSLLRAGVIPRLRQRNWRIHVIKPGARPLNALATMLTLPANAPASLTEMRASLDNDPKTLAFFADKLAQQSDAERLLLAVDQFEELFTQCKDNREQTAFVENFLHAAKMKGATTVLFSIRADFYNRISEFPTLIDLVSQQQEYIKPMEQEELVRIIAEPAKRGNWQLVEGLVELILEDVGREPGRLPLLSHSLLETWKRRRGIVLTLGGYRDAGGVERAIAQTAEETLQSLIDQNPEFEVVIRSIFLDLTELSEGAEDTRRIASREELQTGVDVQLLNLALETLVRARLITIGKEGEVEVAHEALIRRWPTLTDWLADNREQLRFKRQLAHDAVIWLNELDEDKGALYRGARLSQALELVQDKTFKPTTQSMAFLEASREFAEREERERETQRQRELKNAQELAEANRVAVEKAQQAKKEASQRADAEALSAHRLRWMLLLLSTLFLAALLTAYYLLKPILQEREAQELARNRSELILINKTPIIFCKQRQNHQQFNERVFCEFLTGEPDYVISSFLIEKTEVSNQQYSLCVQEGKCTIPNSENFTDPDYKHYPVQGIDGVQAQAYCQWIDRQLPTELQWEAALAGETKHFIEHVNVATVAITNTLHMTKFGIINMLGNVSEWTLTNGTQLRSTKYELEDIWSGDFEDLKFGQTLIIRGDNFLDSTSRRSLEARDDDQTLGVRCVDNNVKGD